MDQLHQSRSDEVARLVPHETFRQDNSASSPFVMMDDDWGHGDVVCSGLEEMSRHLKRLDEEYQLANFEALEVRTRNIVMLADQLGLRLVGQVAADVVYSLDGPKEVALAATLSRLMRLMTQALDHAAGPMTAF